MSQNLNIVSNFSLITNPGSILSGQQGTVDTTGPNDAFVLAVNGQGQSTPFQLASATAQKIWDSTINVPATFQFVHIVCDQALYIQFITSATNFIVQQTAGIPFVMTVASLLAAANTTPLAGSAPSITAIAKIYIQQNSGVAANGQFTIIN